MSDFVLDQVKELMTHLTPLEKAELVAWLGCAGYLAHPFEF